MLQAEKNQYDYKVDIWALGCIMHELLTGTQLFSGNKPYNIRMNILSLTSYMNHWKNHGSMS